MVYSRDMSSRHVVALAILASLFLHFVLGVGISIFPNPSNKKQETVIEIVDKKTSEEFLKKSKNAKQIVRDTLAPDNLKDDSENTLAKFLSAKTQRVLNEVRAKENGMTKNRQELVKQEWKNKLSKNSEAPTKKIPIVDKDGYQAFNSPKEFKRFAEGETGPSTLGEDMPKEMAVGSFTALNTDRYVYYTFYARIEELVRFRWESKVQQALDQFDRSYLISVIGKNRWLTQIEFWLTPDGKFHSAHILKESGIAKFDQAAVFAFRDAQQFPNPPKEMVDRDGFIRIIYAFNVHYSPNVLVEH